jgi:hypothetical protein
MAGRMIKVLAIICKIASADDCQELTVTTSDLADISLQSCMMGAPQLADWMKGHPGYRLASWKCAMGQPTRRGI